MRWSDLDSGFRRNDDMPKLALIRRGGGAMVGILTVKLQPNFFTQTRQITKNPS
jgi:hypothetical protein